MAHLPEPRRRVLAFRAAMEAADAEIEYSIKKHGVAHVTGWLMQQLAGTAGSSETALATHTPAAPGTSLPATERDTDRKAAVLIALHQIANGTSRGGKLLRRKAFSRSHSITVADNTVRLLDALGALGAAIWGNPERHETPDLELINGLGNLATLVASHLGAISWDEAFVAKYVMGHSELVDVAAEDRPEYGSYRPCGPAAVSLLAFLCHADLQWRWSPSHPVQLRSTTLPILRKLLLIAGHVDSPCTAPDHTCLAEHWLCIAQRHCVSLLALSDVQQDLVSAPDVSTVLAVIRDLCLRGVTPQVRHSAMSSFVSIVEAAHDRASVKDFVLKLDADALIGGIISLLSVSTSPVIQSSIWTLLTRIVRASGHWLAAAVKALQAAPSAVTDSLLAHSSRRARGLLDPHPVMLRHAVRLISARAYTRSWMVTGGKDRVWVAMNMQSVPLAELHQLVAEFESTRNRSSLMGASVTLQTAVHLFRQAASWWSISTNSLVAMIDRVVEACIGVQLQQIVLPLDVPNIVVLQASDAVGLWLTEALAGAKTRPLAELLASQDQALGAAISSLIKDRLNWAGGSEDLTVTVDTDLQPESLTATSLGVGSKLWLSIDKQHNDWLQLIADQRAVGDDPNAVQQGPVSVTVRLVGPSGHSVQGWHAAIAPVIVPFPLGRQATDASWLLDSQQTMTVAAVAPAGNLLAVGTKDPSAVIDGNRVLLPAFTHLLLAPVPSSWQSEAQIQSLVQQALTLCQAVGLDVLSIQHAVQVTESDEVPVDGDLTSVFLTAIDTAPPAFLRRCNPLSFAELQAQYVGWLLPSTLRLCVTLAFSQPSNLRGNLASTIISVLNSHCLRFTARGVSITDLVSTESSGDDDDGPSATIMLRNSFNVLCFTLAKLANATPRTPARDMYRLAPPTAIPDMSAALSQLSSTVRLPSFLQILVRVINTGLKQGWAGGISASLPNRMALGALMSHISFLLAVIAHAPATRLLLDSEEPDLVCIYSCIVRWLTAASAQLASLQHLQSMLTLCGALPSTDTRAWPLPGASDNLTTVANLCLAVVACTRFDWFWTEKLDAAAISTVLRWLWVAMELSANTAMQAPAAALLTAATVFIEALLDRQAPEEVQAIIIANIPGCESAEELLTRLQQYIFHAPSPQVLEPLTRLTCSLLRLAILTAAAKKRVQIPWEAGIGGECLPVQKNNVKLTISCDIWALAFLPLGVLDSSGADSSTPGSDGTEAMSQWTLSLTSIYSDMSTGTWSRRIRALIYRVLELCVLCMPGSTWGDPRTAAQVRASAQVLTCAYSRYSALSDIPAVSSMLDLARQDLLAPDSAIAGAACHLLHSMLCRPGAAEALQSSRWTRSETAAVVNVIESTSPSQPFALDMLWLLYAALKVGTGAQAEFKQAEWPQLIHPCLRTLLCTVLAWDAEPVDVQRCGELVLLAMDTLPESQVSHLYLACASIAPRIALAPAQPVLRRGSGASSLRSLAAFVLLLLQEPPGPRRSNLDLYMQLLNRSVARTELGDVAVSQTSPSLYTTLWGAMQQPGEFRLPALATAHTLLNVSSPSRAPFLQTAPPRRKTHLRRAAAHALAVALGLAVQQPDAQEVVAALLSDLAVLLTEIDKTNVWSPETTGTLMSSVSATNRQYPGLHDAAVNLVVDFLARIGQNNSAAWLQLWKQPADITSMYSDDPVSRMQLLRAAHAVGQLWQLICADAETGGSVALEALLRAFSAGREYGVVMTCALMDKQATEANWAAVVKTVLPSDRRLAEMLLAAFCSPQAPWHHRLEIARALHAWVMRQPSATDIRDAMLSDCVAGALLLLHGPWDDDNAMGAMEAIAVSVELLNHFMRHQLVATWPILMAAAPTAMANLVLQWAHSWQPFAGANDTDAGQPLFSRDPLAGWCLAGGRTQSKQSMPSLSYAVRWACWQLIPSWRRAGTSLIPTFNSWLDKLKNCGNNEDAVRGLKLAASFGGDQAALMLMHNFSYLDLQHMGPAVADPAWHAGWAFVVWSIAYATSLGCVAPLWSAQAASLLTALTAPHDGLPKPAVQMLWECAAQCALVDNGRTSPLDEKLSAAAAGLLQRRPLYIESCACAVAILRKHGHASHVIEWLGETGFIVLVACATGGVATPIDYSRSYAFGSWFQDQVMHQAAPTLHASSLALLYDCVVGQRMYRLSADSVRRLMTRLLTSDPVLTDHFVQIIQPCASVLQGNGAAPYDYGDLAKFAAVLVQALERDLQVDSWNCLVTCLYDIVMATSYRVAALSSVLDSVVAVLTAPRVAKLISLIASTDTPNTTRSKAAQILLRMSEYSQALAGLAVVCSPSAVAQVGSAFSQWLHDSWGDPDAATTSIRLLGLLAVDAHQVVVSLLSGAVRQSFSAFVRALIATMACTTDEVLPLRGLKLTATCCAHALTNSAWWDAVSPVVVDWLDALARWYESLEVQHQSMALQATIATLPPCLPHMEATEHVWVANLLQTLRPDNLNLLDCATAVSKLLETQSVAWASLLTTHNIMRRSTQVLAACAQAADPTDFMTLRLAHGAVALSDHVVRQACFTLPCLEDGPSVSVSSFKLLNVSIVAQHDVLCMATVRLCTGLYAATAQLCPPSLTPADWTVLSSGCIHQDLGISTASLVLARVCMLAHRDSAEVAGKNGFGFMLLGALAPAATADQVNLVAAAVEDCGPWSDLSVSFRDTVLWSETAKSAFPGNAILSVSRLSAATSEDVLTSVLTRIGLMGSVTTVGLRTALSWIMYGCDDPLHTDSFEKVCQTNRKRLIEHIRRVSDLKHITTKWIKCCGDTSDAERCQLCLIWLANLCSEDEIVFAVSKSTEIATVWAWGATLLQQLLVRPPKPAVAAPMWALAGPLLQLAAAVGLFEESYGAFFDVLLPQMQRGACLLNALGGTLTSQLRMKDVACAVSETSPLSWSWGLQLASQPARGLVPVLHMLLLSPAALDNWTASNMTRLVNLVLDALALPDTCVKAFCANLIHNLLATSKVDHAALLKASRQREGAHGFRLLVDSLVDRTLQPLHGIVCSILAGLLSNAMCARVMADFRVLQSLISVWNWLLYPPDEPAWFRPTLGRTFVRSLTLFPMSELLLNTVGMCVEMSAFVRDLDSAPQAHFLKAIFYDPASGLVEAPNTDRVCWLLTCMTVSPMGARYVLNKVAVSTEDDIPITILGLFALLRTTTILSIAQQVLRSVAAIERASLEARASVDRDKLAFWFTRTDAFEVLIDAATRFPELRQAECAEQLAAVLEFVAPVTALMSGTIMAQAECWLFEPTADNLAARCRVLWALVLSGRRGAQQTRVNKQRVLVGCRAANLLEYILSQVSESLPEFLSVAMMGLLSHLLPTPAGLLSLEEWDLDKLARAACVAAAAHARHWKPDQPDSLNGWVMCGMQQAANVLQRVLQEPTAQRVWQMPEFQTMCIGRWGQGMLSAVLQAPIQRTDILLGTARPAAVCPLSRFDLDNGIWIPGLFAMSHLAHQSNESWVSVLGRPPTYTGPVVKVPKDSWLQPTSKEVPRVKSGCLDKLIAHQLLTAVGASKQICANMADQDLQLRVRQRYGWLLFRAVCSAEPRVVVPAFGGKLDSGMPKEVKTAAILDSSKVSLDEKGSTLGTEPASLMATLTTSDLPEIQEVDVDDEESPRAVEGPTPSNPDVQVGYDPDVILATSRDEFSPLELSKTQEGLAEGFPQEDSEGDEHEDAEAGDEDEDEDEDDEDDDEDDGVTGPKTVVNLIAMIQEEDVSLEAALTLAAMAVRADVAPIVVQQVTGRLGSIDLPAISRALDVNRVPPDNKDPAYVGVEDPLPTAESLDMILRANPGLRRRMSRVAALRTLLHLSSHIVPSQDVSVNVSTIFRCMQAPFCTDWEAGLSIAYLWGLAYRGMPTGGWDEPPTSMFESSPTLAGQAAIQLLIEPLFQLFVQLSAPDSAHVPSAVFLAADTAWTALEWRKQQDVLLPLFEHMLSNPDAVVRRVATACVFSLAQSPRSWPDLDTVKSPLLALAVASAPISDARSEHVLAAKRWAIRWLVTGVIGPKALRYDPMASITGPVDTGDVEAGLVGPTLDDLSIREVAAHLSAFAPGSGDWVLHVWPVLFDGLCDCQEWCTRSMSLMAKDMLDAERQHHPLPHTQVSNELCGLRSQLLLLTAVCVRARRLREMVVRHSATPNAPENMGAFRLAELQRVLKAAGLASVLRTLQHVFMNAMNAAPIIGEEEGTLSEADLGTIFGPGLQSLGQACESVLKSERSAGGSQLKKLMQGLKWYAANLPVAQTLLGHVLRDNDHVNRFLWQRRQWNIWELLKFVGYAGCLAGEVVEPNTTYAVGSISTTPADQRRIHYLFVTSQEALAAGEGNLKISARQLADLFAAKLPLVPVKDIQKIVAPFKGFTLNALQDVISAPLGPKPKRGHAELQVLFRRLFDSYEDATWRTACAVQTLANPCAELYAADALNSTGSSGKMEHWLEHTRCGAVAAVAFLMFIICTLWRLPWYIRDILTYLRVQQPVALPTKLEPFQRYVLPDSARARLVRPASSFLAMLAPNPSVAEMQQLTSLTSAASMRWTLGMSAELEQVLSEEPPVEETEGPAAQTLRTRRTWRTRSWKWAKQVCSDVRWVLGEVIIGRAFPPSGAFKWCSFVAIVVPLLFVAAAVLGEGLLFAAGGGLLGLDLLLVFISWVAMSSLWCRQRWPVW